MKRYGNIDLKDVGSVKNTREIILTPQTSAPTETVGRIYYNSTEGVFYGRNAIQDVILTGHTQNTDTGTIQTAFIINSDGNRLTFTTATQTSNIIIKGEEIVTLNGAQILTNKILDTPTIANLSNAQHNHSGASKGGQIDYSDLVNTPTTHSQNTDLGTNSQTFDIFKDSAGIKLKANAGVLHLRDLTDTAYANMVVQDLTVSGDLTVLGSGVQLLVGTIEVEDVNISLNKGGTTAGAVGAGLTILGDTDTPIGKLLYDDTLATKFKIGAADSEVEIADISTIQTISNKILDDTNSINASAVDTGTLSTSVLPIEALLTTGTQNITGIKTFTSISGEQPLAIGTPYAPGSTVTNLSADLLDGKHAPTSGDIVGTEEVQELINKTIDGSQNTISNINLATQITGILSIADGGTGSDTKNFVDLTTNQDIIGIKTFIDQVELKAASSQIIVEVAGVTGTLSWTPTGTNKILNFPDKSGTLATLDDVPLDLTGTSSNTWNIDNDQPRSGITNSGITVSSDVNKPTIRYNGNVWQVSNDGITFINLDTFHTQNTDTGTTQDSFIINSDGNRLIFSTSTQTGNIQIAGEKLVTTDSNQALINKTINGSVNLISNINDTALSLNVVLRDNNQTITGLKTFNRASSAAPFAVTTAYAAGATVTNLSADLLDGQHAPSGDIVGTTDIQMLSNKIFNNPHIINGIFFDHTTRSLKINSEEPAVNNRTITFRDASEDDFVVYEKAIQKLDNKTLESPKIKSTLAFEDSSGDIVFNWNSTAARSITIPDATGTLCLIDATQALTSKTIISTTNHISASIIDSGTLDNNRLSATAQDAITKRHAQNTDTGTTADAFEINTNGTGVVLSTANLAATRTFTFPDANGELVTTTADQILTNKTIDGLTNDISNVSLTAGVLGVLPIANGGTGSSTKIFVDLSNNQTISGTKTFSIFPTGPSAAPTADYQLTNKKYVDDLFSGLHVQNTDIGTNNTTFTVNSAGLNGRVILQGELASGNKHFTITNAGLINSYTISATQIKTIAEASHNQNTDVGTTATFFEINSLGNKATLSSVGLIANHIFTFPNRDGEIVIQDATQTLANKTLTTPIISNFSNAIHNHSNVINGGQISYNSLTNLPTIHNQNTDTGTIAASFEINSGGNKLVLTSTDQTANHTFSFPNEDGVLVTEDAVQLLSSKTLDLPTIIDFTNATHDHSDNANGGQLSYNDLANLPSNIHDQNTDAGTNADTFTLDLNGDAISFVNLNFNNGGNDRLIRLEKSTNKLQFQKGDGNFEYFEAVVGHVQNTDLGTTQTTFQVNTLGNGVIIDSAGLTDDRTFTFPDNDGEILTEALILDEDDMASDSDQHLATQQSIKAYVDNAVVVGGGSYLETNFTNQSNVVVTHNFSKYPKVFMIDSSGIERVIDVVHNSRDQVTVSWIGIETGTIICS